MPDKLESLIAGGDLDAIEEFASEEEETIAVDWRDHDDGLVDAVAERLRNDMLSYEWIDSKKNMDLRLVFNGLSEEAGLTGTPVDRCVTICALNRVMVGRHEIRAFSCNVGSDTLYCCLRPAGWWNRVDSQFPEQASAAFTKFRDGVDLFAMSGAEEAAAAPQRDWKVAAKAAAEAQQRSGANKRPRPRSGSAPRGPIRAYLPNKGATAGSPGAPIRVKLIVLGILLVFVVSFILDVGCHRHAFFVVWVISGLVGIGLWKLFPTR